MDNEQNQNNHPIIIPQLNPTLSIHSFGLNHILAECNQHQLKLKKEFLHIFELVNGKNTITDIAQQYALISNQTISENFIYNLLYNDLATYGIVISNKPVMKGERALHLRLSFIFWRGKSLDITSAIISPLFNPVFFYSSLGLMLVFIVPALLYFKYNHISSAFEFKNMAVYATVSFIIVMLHELGHVSACNRYGAKHKGIGFGFYLFIPTFFADVSDAWKLPAKQRVIINLAGIYVELVIVTVLLVLYFIYKAEIMFYASTAILLGTVINLNPFVKYDGYWVLSDITHTANLSKQAGERLKNLFSKHAFRRFTRYDYVLLLYAITSYLMIGMFMLIVFFYDPQSLIQLPIKIWSRLINYPTLLHIRWNDLISALGAHLSAILFYILLSRMVFTYLKKYIHKIKPVV